MNAETGPGSQWGKSIRGGGCESGRRMLCDMDWVSSMVGYGAASYSLDTSPSSVRDPDPNHVTRSHPLSYQVLNVAGPTCERGGQDEDMGKWLKIARHCSVLVRFPKLRPSLSRSLYPISLFSFAVGFDQTTHSSLEWLRSGSLLTSDPVSVLFFRLLFLFGSSALVFGRIGSLYESTWLELMDLGEVYVIKPRFAWDCSLALLHERDWLTTRESTPVRGPCRLPWSCTSVLLLVVNLIRITRHPSLLLCQMKCCI
ncbi:hypothetical protein MUK42_21793 [Musa troglodytarum]|uniref:Uncharacterized protein n=1 Tax=Musa troglodytarum TaxID=320322 RepID=A0A9E7K9B9_9LILI|nr:hypothetical protein MUK42_21793 [Musa troglodytarum]